MPQVVQVMSPGAQVQPPEVEQVDVTITASVQVHPLAADRDRVAKWRAQAMTGQQWRRDAARAHEYWDGNQISGELLAKMRKRGLPPLVHNVIKRWINAVVGSQERSLTDGVVTVEDNRYQPYAQALSEHLKTAERMTNTDRACLDAFSDAVQGGIGWVEVGDGDDPLGYPHRVEQIPWREVYWDTRAVKQDMADAEWFRRIRYYRRHDAERAFPDQAAVIAMAGTESDTIGWYEPERLERDFRGDRDESRWWDFGQRDDSVCLSEFRYRVWVDGYVVDTPAGRIEFDPANPMLARAAQQGLIRPQPCRLRKVRQAFWLGPYCLSDDWCPVAGNQIGWVPFTCYREDETGGYYGLIRDMMSLQDEVNVTKSKAHWSMDSTTVVMDQGRVVDADALATEVNRRDGIIVLDPTMPGGLFQIDRHEGVTQQQLALYQDAVQKIGYVHGLDAAFAGVPTGQSGVALQTQVAQGMTAIGAPLNRFNQSRKCVLQLLLTRLEAHMGQRMLGYKDRDGNECRVAVNIPVQLSDGTVQLLSPQNVRRSLVLEEVPSTPTYRHEQFLQMIDTMRALPPQAQLVLLPALIAASDLPDREKYVQLAQQQMQQAQQASAAQVQAAQQQTQFQQAVAQAKMQVEQATSQKLQAQAQQTAAQTQQMQAQLLKLAAEVQNLRAKTAQTQAQAADITQGMAERAKLMQQQPPPQTTTQVRLS